MTILARDDFDVQAFMDGELTGDDQKDAGELTRMEMDCIWLLGCVIVLPCCSCGRLVPARCCTAVYKVCRLGRDEHDKC